MNYDLALIARILEERNFGKAIRAGADRPGLLGPEAKMYFNIIAEHHRQYHEVPSLEMFREKVPSYHHVLTTDSVEALVDQLKSIKLSNELEDIVSKVAKIKSKSPWEAKELLSQLVEGLSLRHSKGNNYYIFGEDAQETVDLMATLKEKHGLIGYPWPWDFLNQNSLGVMDGELYYIYGRQKSRKTFLVLYMVLFYWAIGLKVLLFTREMSPEQLKWRLIALQGNFNFVDVLKNRLPEGSTDRIKQMMDEIFDTKKLIITDVAGGVGGFISAIEDVQPDIVFHDYFKSMADDAMGDKVNGEHRYVARCVDQMASYIAGKAKIPLFFVGHANRDGARGRSSTEHAWSDHITRRVHGAFRVMTHADTNRMAFFLNAARNMEEGMGMTLNAKLCEDFGRMLSTDYSWINTVQTDDAEAASRGNSGGNSSGGGQPSSASSSSADDGEEINFDSFR